MKIKLLLIFSLLYLQLSAQNFPTDSRIALTVEPLEMVEKITMPALNNQILLNAELSSRGPGIAPKFAKNMEVNITPDTHGNWEDLADGNSVWRMKIESTNAKSLNLGFTKYFMPESGSLILYSPNYERIISPFTPSDNEEHEQLWTPILDGDELVIEVQIPTTEKENLQLKLSYVNHDFIGFSSMVSGNCNLDVICGMDDGFGLVDNYRDIIQSVARITTGDGFCTGFLVNNANNDCAPLFMTAFHCQVTSGNAASMVAYWNFSNSTCRQPGSAASGGNGDGSTGDFNTGAIFRAGWQPSDFTLVELDDPVSETADAFYAGWDATETITVDTVIAVHHPSGHEKRISFDFDQAFAADGFSTTPNPNGDHFTVADWDIGTTEGGSSGSPLFNNQKQVIGQLHGGAAACGNDAYDSYGWFFSSWEGGGTTSTRLKDWLDPDDTGTLVMDGRSQQQCNIFVEGIPAAVTVCPPNEAVFTISATESFVNDVTLSVTNLPIGATATFAENPIISGATTTLTISNTDAISEGVYTLNLTGTDGTNTTENTLTLAVFAGVPTPTALLLPALGAMPVSTSPIFTWNAQTALTYEIEIATDNSFSNIVEQADGLTSGSYQSVGLNTQTMYFWRVRATNSCGVGNFATPFFFTTPNIFCAPTITAADVPVLINESSSNIIISTIEIGQNGTIEDLDVSNLIIEHTYISDLIISLTSPTGTTIVLVNASAGDCENDDLELNFDDNAANTNTDLVNMCNNTPPAASGTFQPENPLSTFNGESVQGIWTLTIEDIFYGDGGQLLSWNLDICSFVPDDFAFVASESTLTGCVEETVSFDLTVGGAFDDANGGVSLSANNLPTGAMASFSQNPVPPGSVVTVTLENVMQTGGFSIEIMGDDGTNSTVSTNLIWNVNGPPPTTTAINPTDNATDQPITLTMEWEAVSGTSSYNYIIATDPSFVNIVATFPAINNSFFQSDLAYNTTYYWMVTTEGACGSTESEIFTFTTFPDFTVNINPEVETVCLTDEAAFALNLGGNFANATITANNLPGLATANFSMNPASGGETVIATIGNLITVAPGTYTIEFTIADDNGTTNVSAVLTVVSPPTIATLQLPGNGEIMIPISGQSFNWEAIVGADNYLFELSLNNDFTQIVQSQTVTTNSYTLTDDLSEETLYFWRVIAMNECGSGISLVFNFTSEDANSTQEVLGVEVTLQPNPTRNFVHISWSAPLNEILEMEVFAINGQLLQTAVLNGQNTQHQIDLSPYAAGVYLVKLVTGQSAIVERIVLEK